MSCATSAPKARRSAPLRILILNLMPTKIVTETQLARLLANSPLQVRITFLQTATHSTTHTPQEHMKAFYKTFDEVKNERYDGMIITGAPLEDMDYEQVDYWDELCGIMDFSKTNVYSTIHLCWGGAGRAVLSFRRAQGAPAAKDVRCVRAPGHPAVQPAGCAALTRCSTPPTAAGPA